MGIQVVLQLLKIYLLPPAAFSLESFSDRYCAFGCSQRTCAGVWEKMPMP